MQIFPFQMHPASISAIRRDDVSHNLRHAATLESMVDSRLRYNAAELRGILKHTFTQTEPSVGLKICERHDEELQVTSDGDELPRLREEIKSLRLSLDSERCRFQQREKLLISQMNAIRDLGSGLESQEIVVMSLSVKSFEFDLQSLPPVYDRVTWTVSCMESARDDRILAVAQSNYAVRQQSSLEVMRDPCDVKAPRSAGQVTLHFRFLAQSSSADQPQFPLILGEWMSPLFIPCLKETGTVESMPVTLEGVGVATFDLVFR